MNKNQCLQYHYEKLNTAQLAGGVEYTDSISAEEKLTHNECLGYDIKLSNGKAPVLELWEMRSTPLLSLTPGWLWAGMVAPEMGKIELFDI